MTRYVLFDCVVTWLKVVVELEHAILCVQHSEAVSLLHCRRWPTKTLMNNNNNNTEEIAIAGVEQNVASIDVSCTGSAMQRSPSIFIDLHENSVLSLQHQQKLVVLTIST
jgi:hypothetical protein